MRRLRLEANLTQQELAERLGVDRAHVSSLESGTRNPTVISLWHLSLALRVQMTRFFDDIPGPAEGEPVYIKKRASKRRGPRKEAESR
ncbi:helix-turn-helix domain-containing protein [Microvirga sp. ACRRW]|nr:helix-turn-helix transcriptional regulator [Microvirga sp. ACRRW]MCG7391967.1 helix-turn-helix domain-containing protein [Microvirga sp. ACRRW]